METFAKYKVHQGHRASALAFDLEMTDKPSGAATDFYYVRVIQKNGQRAWSSPVWVDAE